MHALDYLFGMLSAHLIVVARMLLGPCLAGGLLSASPPTRDVRPATVQLGRQIDRIDVGSFTLFLHDQRAGREQFSMQRVVAADGATLELRAESAVGDRRSAVRLEADSAGSPVRYSVEERTGAMVTLRLGGQRVRGRFTTLARSTSGEAAREYLLVPGAVVLEDHGVLQYALLVLNRLHVEGDSTVIPVITPIANRQGTVQLALMTISDTVVIAGSRRQARRWRAVTDRGESRFIWADAEGRLLRVQIPSRGFNALRDDVPR